VFPTVEVADELEMLHGMVLPTIHRSIANLGTVTTNFNDNAIGSSSCLPEDTQWPKEMNRRYSSGSEGQQFCERGGTDSQSLVP
jgi:hypothetical protein